MLLESTSSKKSYTKAQDEQIIKLRKEGKSVEEVATAVGHSPASIQYRIQRVLTKVNSFDDIKYKSVTKAATPEPKK